MRVWWGSGLSLSVVVYFSVGMQSPRESGVCIPGVLYLQMCNRGTLFIVATQLSQRKILVGTVSLSNDADKLEMDSPGGRAGDRVRTWDYILCLKEAILTQDLALGSVVWELTPTCSFRQAFCSLCLLYTDVGHNFLCLCVCVPVCESVHTYVCCLHV